MIVFRLNILPVGMCLVIKFQSNCITMNMPTAKRSGASAGYGQYLDATVPRQIDNPPVIDLAMLKNISFFIRTILPQSETDRAPVS